jgi:predicted dehydrogenase
MLRVAIVGCGKIADLHVEAIHRIPDCEIVAVCDRERLMAQQLAERFRIPALFADLHEMLVTSSPDVAHITTPPQSHYSLARECMNAGVHVYLEKPFTVTAAETEALIALARSSGVKITAGHNYQFTLEMLDMRRRVADGYLGGRPVHLESYWSYNLDDLSYAGPVLASRTHWVRQLPGQLLHNVISHGIARLAEFLDDEITQVIATAHQSPRLRALGGGDVLDELRVLVRDRNGTTALFCFSSGISPGLSQFRICGPVNSLVVDQRSGSLLLHPKRAHKSYLTYFVPPVTAAREHLRNARVNVARFLRRELHQDFGVKELIDQFYRSIRESGPLPVPYREIILTARLMEEIFGQIYAPQSRAMATSQRG